MSEREHSDTQSIDRAVALLRLIGGAGADGARFSELVAASGLAKPTVRRILLALARAGLVDQDEETRRYRVGPELYVLGRLASTRFGIHALARDTLARISGISEDTSFLSVPRDTLAVCLHREEGSFPIRTHALKVGDRHPLGIGSGSLAILAALSDEEVERVLERNSGVIAEQYPNYSTAILRDMRARSLANAAWLLSEPYGGARDHTQAMRVGRSHRPGRWNPRVIRPCHWAPRVALEQAHAPQLLEICDRRPVRQRPSRARQASDDFLRLLRNATH